MFNHTITKFITKYLDSLSIRTMSNAHKKLINDLRKQGLIKDDRIEEVMASVDRANFTDNNPTKDSPQPIGYGVTISAPHMHAIALNALKDHLKPGMAVLDVGSGSGYLTACMAKLVAPNGKAIGVEHVDQLVKFSTRNCTKIPDIAELFNSKVLQFITTDGRNGYSDEAPYDAIHVGAAAENVPQELLNQLKPGGRFICPVGSSVFGQSLMQIDRTLDGEFVKKDLMQVRYVPLTDLKKQLGE